MWNLSFAEASVKGEMLGTGTAILDALLGYGVVFIGLLLDHIESVVADLLGRAALTVKHDLVNQLCDHHGPIHRIGQYLALRDKSTTGHSFPP